MPQFICQHSAITETIVTQRPLAFLWFDFHLEGPGFVGISAIFSVVNTHVIGTRNTQYVPHPTWLRANKSYQYAHQQAVSSAVNGSRRFRDCLNLDKRSWKHPNSRRGTVHVQSETPRFYVSSVIFAMNGALKYCKNIKTYVLRCTTIGFKQKYGHKSSRRADMNLRCKSETSQAGGGYPVGSTK